MMEPEDEKTRYAKVRYNENGTRFVIEFDRPFDFKVFEQIVTSGETYASFMVNGEESQVLGLELSSTHNNNDNGNEEKGKEGMFYY